MPQENAIRKNDEVIGKNCAIYRQVGMSLHFIGIIDPNEIDDISKVQKNIIIVSTDLHERAIPHRLSLNKESIKKDELLVHFSNVEERFWKE